MRLLLFSDLHCDTAAARNLVEMSGEADIVIGAGDFAKQRAGLHPIIKTLAAIDRPTILVPGNSESHSELVVACQKWPAVRVLHGAGTKVRGVIFYGVGGGIPTTGFGSKSFDLSEDEGRRLLAHCPHDVVLVTHSPPKGVLDEESFGKHRGSEAILETIKRCQPRLVVCGHIHTCAGKSEKIGTTPVVNPGPTGYRWELLSM